MESPSIMIKEILRRTGVSPSVVIRYLFSENPIVDPRELNGLDKRGWFKQINRPQSTKKADRIWAELWSEGQRWQRRFQFPSSCPKTTRGKAEARIIKMQLENVRLKLKAKENSLNIPSSQGDQEFKDQDRYSEYSKGERKEAELQALKLLSILRPTSVVPMERPQRIKEIFIRAAFKKDPVFVINWVCPAGTPLQPTPDTRGLYRSFVGVDPVSGLQKDYRLVPRLDLERNLIRAFERSDIPLWYIKLVADDNLYCLYPYAIEKDGEKESMKAIKTYAEYTQQYLDQEVGNGKINVMTVSEFLGAAGFSELITLFESTTLQQLLPYLPPNIIDIERDVIAKHTQLEPRFAPLLDILVERVICQYACEGLIIKEMFGDEVVIAWNESTRRAATIDAAGKATGKEAFPKFFVLHRKRGKTVEQDY